MIDNEPLDVYSRKDMYDDEVMDTIYVNNREFKTLYYDLDQNTEDFSEMEAENADTIQPFTSQHLHHNIQHLHHTLRQISRFLHLCAHSRTHKVYVLLKPSGKVKKTWYKKLFK